MIERILALDSLVNVLTVQERINLQKQRQLPVGWFYFSQYTEMIKILTCLILRYGWYPPKRKYDDAKMEVWLNPNTGDWQPIETYQHQIINEVINQIPVKK